MLAATVRAREGRFQELAAAVGPVPARPVLQYWRDHVVQGGECGKEGGSRRSGLLAGIRETFGLGLSMHSSSHLGISLAAMVRLAAA